MTWEYHIFSIRQYLSYDAALAFKSLNAKQIVTTMWDIYSSKNDFLKKNFLHQLKHLGIYSFHLCTLYNCNIITSLVCSIQESPFEKEKIYEKIS